MKINKRSSEILLDIANDKKLDGDLTFHRILEILGVRAFGIGLLFFALPSALPVSAIPGISFIFSLPVLLLAVQMIMSRKTIWLPKIVAKHTIHHKTICKIVHASSPYLKKAELLLKPRLLFMTSPIMERVNGTVIALLACLLMLPIPLSNFIFSSLIIMFSLGFIEKDGIFVIAGYVGSFLYVSFIYTIIATAIQVVFK